MSLIVFLTRVLLGLEMIRINSVDDGPVNSGRSYIVSFHDKIKNIFVYIHSPKLVVG